MVRIRLLSNIRHLTKQNKCTHGGSLVTRSWGEPHHRVMGGPLSSLSLSLWSLGVCESRKASKLGDEESLEMKVQYQSHTSDFWRS